eukprot:3798685-Prymnesium_polylepis.1
MPILRIERSSCSVRYIDLSLGIAYSITLFVICPKMTRLRVLGEVAQVVAVVAAKLVGLGERDVEERRVRVDELERERLDDQRVLVLRLRAVVLPFVEAAREHGEHRVRQRDEHRVGEPAHHRARLDLVLPRQPRAEPHARVEVRHQ